MSSLFQPFSRSFTSRQLLLSSAADPRRPCFPRSSKLPKLFFWNDSMIKRQRGDKLWVGNSLGDVTFIIHLSDCLTGHSASLRQSCRSSNLVFNIMHSLCHLTRSPIVHIAETRSVWIFYFAQGANAAALNSESEGGNFLSFSSR